MVSLGIFARPPTPGRVKTRLIPDIGADNAARVYRYCLEHTLDVAARSGLAFQIYLSEASNDALFARASTLLQHGDDLGARMLRALQQQLKGNPGGAMIIGTDCLDLSVEHLQQAARALTEHDLVVSPAIDGGYALIGCTCIEADLFRDISWSTDQVLTQTLANAHALNYGVGLLETVRDIDRLQDLEHYPELLDLISSPHSV